MSRKIAVLDLHQADSDKPVTYVKRSVADLLVRRLLAVWVIDKQVIRHVAVRSLREFTSMKFVLPTRPYIPEKLPPGEVENCKFTLKTADKTHKFYMELARRGNSFDPRGYEFKSKPWQPISASV